MRSYARLRLISAVMRARIITATGLFFVLFACSASQSLSFRLADWDINYLVDHSAIILVAMVTETKEIAPTRTIEGYNVQLQQVSLVVEEVLKGQISAQHTEFYRYAPAQPVLRKAPSPDRIAPGTRSIFFLDNENGFLRAMIDATQSRVPIRSGQHKSQWTAWEKLPVKEEIADIMFTPGDDIDVEGFAKALRVDSWLSFELVGDLKMLRLLKQSLNNSAPAIRGNACLEIAHNFEGQSDCLNAMKEDTSIPAELRRQAEEQLKATQEQDEELLATFTKYPSRWLSHRVGSEDRAAICERADVLTQHPNRTIATKAVEFLNSEFPDFSKNGCPRRAAAQP